MTKIATHAWDVTEHLETDDDIAVYLEAAFEEGDPALIAAALGDIARARGNCQRRWARSRKSVQGPFAWRQPGVRHNSEGGIRTGIETPCVSCSR